MSESDPLQTLATEFPSDKISLEFVKVSMNRAVFLAGLVASALVIGAAAAEQSVAKRLMGTWRLIDVVEQLF